MLPKQEPVDIRQKFLGWAIIVAELTIQQLGFVATTGLPSYSAAVAASIIGSLTPGCIAFFHGSPKLKNWDSKIWALVLRLAFSNAIIGFAYIQGSRLIGVGPMAAIGALGVLSVGVKEIFASLNEGRSQVRRWARNQLLVRALALAGVVILTQPWNGTFDPIGVLCGVISAGCFWNYVTVVFGHLQVRGMVKEGLGIANMLSVPLISLAVLPFGGWELMDLHIFLVAGAAGLAILTIPALLQNWATALRVSARTSGILYAFDSTIAAIIGMIGGHFGFGEAQSLSLWGWVGILLVLIASICATLLSAES